ncbi:hypothetical protein [Prevotella sp. 10(H)]|uniref:hypothetical protein n=1 Tax=Prevotella sp. 10(H) TaxID=1158294 RepID=UPI0004A6B67B|nr:hypothetical protein [Prevotella sp. 10(H)]
MISTEILNSKLQEAIRNKFPKETNIAKIIGEILFIGKEAAYRRLRGEVGFSLYEATLIAHKLNISLDKIINVKPIENSIFELKPQQFYNLSEIDYQMLEEYLNTLKLAKEDTNSEQVFTSNIFPQFPSHRYYMLAKYSSFRWMYLNETMDRVKSFNEMNYPERMDKLCREIVDESTNISRTSYIWDNNIFQSIVKEIKYFSNIGLINAESILLLKNELFEFLDYIEKITTKGKFDNGNKVQIYISEIPSDTGYSYLETNFIKLSMISAFALNYLVALDERTLIRMKERIQSLKRVSTLISESGEEQRIRFLKAQRQAVNTLR